MTTTIKEIYEALIDAGANDKKATAAAVAAAVAVAIADYDSRFNRFATNLEEIRSEQHVIRWIAAFNLAFTLAVVWKIFT